VRHTARWVYTPRAPGEHRCGARSRRLVRVSSSGAAGPSRAVPPWKASPIGPGCSHAGALCPARVWAWRRGSHPPRTWFPLRPGPRGASATWASTGTWTLSRVGGLFVLRRFVPGGRHSRPIQPVLPEPFVGGASADHRCLRLRVVSARLRALSFPVAVRGDADADSPFDRVPSHPPRDHSRGPRSSSVGLARPQPVARCVRPIAPTAEPCGEPVTHAAPGLSAAAKLPRRAPALSGSGRSQPSVTWRW
jgi:hypothetical protein